MGVGVGTVGTVGRGCVHVCADVGSSVQLRAHVGALLNGLGAVVEGCVSAVQL